MYVYACMSKIDVPWTLWKSMDTGGDLSLSKYLNCYDAIIRNGVTTVYHIITSAICFAFCISNRLIRFLFFLIYCHTFCFFLSLFLLSCMRTCCLMSWWVPGMSNQQPGSWHYQFTLASDTSFQIYYGYQIWTTPHSEDNDDPYYVYIPLLHL